MLLELTILFERAWILLIGSLGQTSPTLTSSLLCLLSWTLIAQIGLLIWTPLPKISLLEQTELAPAGLLERILLPIIGLLGWKIIVMTCSSKRTLLPQMDLPGLTEPSLTV